MPGIYPALFSGSGGISSAAVPDPYVPVDGTMNVTGAIVASSTITASTSGVVLGASSVAALGYGITGINSASAPTAVVGKTNTSLTGVLLDSYQADGATAIAARTSAQADYTTAGARLHSFGDNGGVTYAEKAAIMFDGTVKLTPTALAISGAHTALPVGGIVEVTCTGAQTWTITETGATNGEIHHIVNVGTDALTMDHVAGQVLLNGGADVVLGQGDCITIYYSTALSAWVQLGATSNN